MSSPPLPRGTGSDAKYPLPARAEQGLQQRVLAAANDRPPIRAGVHRSAATGPPRLWRQIASVHRSAPPQRGTAVAISRTPARDAPTPARLGGFELGACPQHLFRELRRASPANTTTTNPTPPFHHRRQIVAHAMKCRSLRVAMAPAPAFGVVSMCAVSHGSTMPTPTAERGGAAGA
jgi:hypothetical protein